MTSLRESQSLSRCRLGHSRVEITPPVGIYHRFWGAAVTDRATGVHRPLLADIVWFAPSEHSDQGGVGLVTLDHCLFRPDDLAELTTRLAKASGVPAENLIVLFGHTHSGGHIARSRSDQPGGELIGPYLDALPDQLAAAVTAARRQATAVTLQYGAADCRMGRNRDLWDPSAEAFVCGFNPDDPSTTPVTVVRAVDDSGQPRLHLVNYACHPTTLAWQNTLISPDYIGALRETVEQSTNTPCVFLLAPCGDRGPRHGFVGDTAIADRNGRQVGHAALSAVYELDGRAGEFCYQGSVLSGATLGVWKPQALPAERSQAIAGFEVRRWHVPLPYRSDLPGVQEIESELEHCDAQAAEAVARQDTDQLRLWRAKGERKRRLLERLRPLPPGEMYPYEVRAWKLGDVVWLAFEGEPYWQLTAALSRRFPDLQLVTLTLADGARCSYLPTAACWSGPSRYQVDVAVLAAGALERLIDAVSRELEDW